MAIVRDVVCGMDIEAETAAATSEYRGSTYYFCAVPCKRDFDADPEKFLSGAASPAMSGGTTGKRWWQFWKA